MALIADRVAAARQGANPGVIARLRSGWAVIGDRQFLSGYCLLLSDPVVPTLNDLTGAGRQQFLADMASLGDAVLAITTPTGAIRINYSIYGNLEPELHAHVFPRYRDESAELRTRPPWFYSEEQQRAHPFDLTAHGPLMAAIRRELVRLGAEFDPQGRS